MENEVNVEIIEIGIASIETKGPVGVGTDLQIAQVDFGLSDD